MTYKLIYEGSDPPADMKGDAIRAIEEDECAVLYAAGRAKNDNYSIIIDDGAARKYWSPKVDPEPAQPIPPTTKQQILDQIAVFQKLADDLK